MVKLTIVYDNEVFEKGLRSDWGFSCYVQTPDTNLLFDTGAKGDILLHNMEKLGIDPREIDAVMLSHDHWDHTGGLSSLLKVNSEVTVHKPTFSRGPREFLEGFMTTGPLDSPQGIKEQSLLVSTKRGTVVVTGCSHPGLENILDAAHHHGTIYAVLGGFHGFNEFEALKQIPHILPCHCTQQKQEILRSYPDTSEICGAGKTIEV